MKGRERKCMFHNTSNQTSRNANRNTSRNKKIFSFSMFMIIFLASFTVALIVVPFNVEAAAQHLRLYVDGDGDTVDWDVSGAEVPDYTMVDETETDGDTTYVHTRTLNDIEEFDHTTNAVLEEKIITNVRVTAGMKHVLASGATVNIGVKVQGTRYGAAADSSLSAAWADHFKDWANNPDDGEAWQKSDIDDLQSSLKLITCIGVGGQSTWCTQVFLTVTYDTNAAPSNGAPAVDEWDAGAVKTANDNCYAQRRWYYVNVTYTDTNGCTDFDHVRLDIKPPGLSPVAIFYYGEANNTFWKGGSEPGKWTLDTSLGLFTKIENDIIAVWKFMPNWDATEFSNMDFILNCEDDQEVTDQDTNDANFDVVTTLLTNSIECDDSDNPDRVGIGSTIDMPFEVRYADEPSSNTPSSYYPPDAEFTSVSVYRTTLKYELAGTNSSIVNGDGSVSFEVLPTVGSYDYQLNVTMADGDYGVGGDTSLTNLNETVIADKIRINWSSNQYSIDEGTEMTISLDDVVYDYDSVAAASYQYNYTIQRAGETTDSYSGNTSSSFTFTPKIAGYYYLNLTAFKDTTAQPGSHGITSYLQNGTVLLTVKQNISLVKNDNNNGVNYLTWAVNDSIMASKLADDLGLESNVSHIQIFNPGSSDGWNSDKYITDVGPDFEINRWDHLRILVNDSRAHSFTPDAGVDPSQNINMTFNSTNQGYNYVTWSNDSSISASNFTLNLDLGGNNDMEINVYNSTTGISSNYNPSVPADFQTDFTINPYDIICFRAPTHNYIVYIVE